MRGIGPVCLMGILTASIGFSMKEDFFDADARARVKAFWAAENRVKVKSAPMWQARLTPEGSKWLLAFRNAKGQTKSSTTVTVSTPAEWDTWVDQKYFQDRLAAENQARQFNGLPSPDIAVEDPGPVPAGMVEKVGSIPKFLEAALPSQTTVTFDDGQSLSAENNIAMAQKSPYYRYREGIRVFGTALKAMPEAERDALFVEAGYSPTERRVTLAVSQLEGGFDAVNTYDTGFVSIGFIQFACLSKGQGSLGQALLNQKKADSPSFDRDFRQYGIDVSDEGSLVVYDSVTDSEAIGFAAAQLIIQRPALALVFQRAGQKKEFRLAQLRTAKALYYPFDAVTFMMKDKSVTLQVPDLFSSESALATLMDRKVHTGTFDPLSQVLTGLCAELNITEPAQLKQFEGEIVTRIIHRRNYLAEAALSQPDPKTKLRDSNRSSRGGDRSGGGGKK